MVLAIALAMPRLGLAAWRTMKLTKARTAALAGEMARALKMRWRRRLRR